MTLLQGIIKVTLSQEFEGAVGMKDYLQYITPYYKIGIWES